ncbi:hypothetical protein [Pseudonocardia sp. GCM10023141]|uniref:hypothetical protein n=1 Tax=Pseudonocardia sp. GCM10023141 TaxID=3252653 RepID=UPI00361FBF92
MNLFSGPVPAIVLAILASLCFAGAAVLQHRAVSAQSGAATSGGEGALSFKSLAAIARRPGWLAGLALAVSGTTMHAIALVLAPLSVVQPIGVLAVPIAVVLSVLRTGQKPAPGVLLGVGLSVAGVAAFVATAAGTAVSSPAPDGATLLAALVVAALVLALAALGLARTGWVRCVACATGGAVAFGLVSALLRAVSQSVTTGVVDLLAPSVLLSLVGIAVAVLTGGWLVQQAFTVGAPEVVVACLTVVDPIVAVILGVVLLGEGAHTSTQSWLLLLGAAAMAATGVVALASHHPDAAGRSERTAEPVSAPGPVERARLGNTERYTLARRTAGHLRSAPPPHAVAAMSRREHLLHRR